MPAASSVSSVTGNALPKWQLALAIGAPVALGLGYMYYKNSTKPTSKPDRGKTKYSSKENGTTASKQISIDDDCNSKGDATSPRIESFLEKAESFKSKGNVHFKLGKYDEAIAMYNNAIDICPPENKQELATFYQNRAAAYEQLRKFSAVKSDCTKALELNPKYAKALLRRARALEHCNDLERALEDVTAACIVERFSNQTALTMADRVLKQLGRQHAEEYFANKVLVMPSKHFIKTYISSFHNDPVSSAFKDLNNDNAPVSLIKIIKALDTEDYDSIIPLCTEIIDNGKEEISAWKPHVLLLRATFYLLLGKHDAAFADFDIILKGDDIPKEIKVNALTKRATLHMQLQNLENCFADFDAAVNIDPNCGDIYHHRGQVHLLMEEIFKAKADLEKAVELNPDFGIAYAQMCYALHLYSMACKDMSLKVKVLTEFDKAFEKFPDCTECYTLYAQLLLNTEDYIKADKYFVKAIEKNPHNAAVYVHRGMIQLQYLGSIDKAVELIKKALEVDEKCEFGYETLGTIEVQRGNYKEAIQLFEKAIALSRTMMELTHLFSLRDAAKAQLTLKDRFPDLPISGKIRQNEDGNYEEI